jgi:hypothetical protein
VFDAKEQGLDPSFRLTRYANVKVGHPDKKKKYFFFSCHVSLDTFELPDPERLKKRP